LRKPHWENALAKSSNENFADGIVDREEQLRGGFEIVGETDSVREAGTVVGARLGGFMFQTATAIDMAIGQEMLAGKSDRAHTTESRSEGEWIGEDGSRRSADARRLVAAATFYQPRTK
jgi:hypothetical protein